MADLFWLSDAQWVVIEPFMPTNQPVARRVDDRKTISGITDRGTPRSRAAVARAPP